MHTFRLWKRYPEAVEKEFRVSDFTGGSFSVQRGPNNDEACTASWSWVKPVHFLEELGFVGEGPVRTPGVALSWSSRRGPEGGWSYTVVSDSGTEESGRLPVPALADPAVIVGMMPALWRGHHRQLRASEDRWEWAAGVESSTESARLLSEDKYDLDYQLDEEEGENFNQWQAQLEDTQQPAHAPDGEKGGSPAEITASVPVRNSTLALTLDDPAPGVSAALEALATLAWHSYGIALHYTGEDDPNGAEATMEAMRHAVQAVAPGFTAATLVRLANDPQLGLTTEQRLYIDELAIALDLETLEALHGADPGTSSEEEK